MANETLAEKSRLRCGVFMPPWLLPLASDPTVAIRREIDFIEFLDHAGYDEAWVGEHHSGGMEIIGSPELLIAAAIERTHRIRLGTGVISLPFHNPFTVADRIVQLDHQARGRAMFGFGPGLLPGDAHMLGIPSEEQRSRMAESLDVIIRLLGGETVTQDAEWFTLNEARLQLRPYTLPRPELAVASAITPSGGKIAGRYGLSMLCMAAASGPGYDVLDENWGSALDVAEKHGMTMNRSNLRLLAQFHIAETRDEAIHELEEGFHRWAAYMDDVVEGGSARVGYASFEELVESERDVVGVPEDAVAALERYWEKSGGFGCILVGVTHFAGYEATKRSHQMFVEQVMPAFTSRSDWRFASHEWATNRRAELCGNAFRAIQKTIDEHFGAKGTQPPTA